jgi:protein transport protein SEC31
MSPTLKCVERAATVAFCPHTGMLAAGTVAGAVDMSFSTNSVLEVRAGEQGGGPRGLWIGADRRGIWETSPLPPPPHAQVFPLDFTTKGESLPVSGTLQAPERFNRIAWGGRLADGPNGVSAIPVGGHLSACRRAAKHAR